MNQLQNDRFATTQKNFHPLSDLKPFIPPDSFHTKTGHQDAHPSLDSETRSFVVTWQLPGVEYKDVNKSNS